MGDGKIGITPIVGAAATFKVAGVERKFRLIKAKDWGALAIRYRDDIRKFVSENLDKWSDEQRLKIMSRVNKDSGLNATDALTDIDTMIWFVDRLYEKTNDEDQWTSGDMTTEGLYGLFAELQDLSSGSTEGATDGFC